MLFFSRYLFYSFLCYLLIISCKVKTSSKPLKTDVYAGNVDRKNEVILLGTPDADGSSNAKNELHIISNEKSLKKEILNVKDSKKLKILLIKNSNNQEKLRSMELDLLEIERSFGSHISVYKTTDDIYMKAKLYTLNVESKKDNFLDDDFKVIFFYKGKYIYHKCSDNAIGDNLYQKIESLEDEGNLDMFKNYSYVLNLIKSL